jgi:uroporphyrinogen-III synthase
MAGLAGKRVLVTRPRGQAAALCQRLSALGAVPVLLPTIDIEPPSDPAALQRAARRAGAYDWIVFTSVNGVAAFEAPLWGLNGSAVPRIAAIGPATARALEARGAPADFVPQEFVAEALAEGLGEVRGLRVLMPRAEEARDVLARELRARGAVVHEVAAYRTRLAAPDESALAELRRGVDVITFTSSSTVRGFMALLEGLGLRLDPPPLIACIGPVTTATARALGLRVDVTAQTYTGDGLVDAIKAYLVPEVV